RDQQHMLGDSQLDEMPANQRPAFEVEDARGFLRHQLLRFTLRVSAPAEVSLFKRETDALRGDKLDGLIVYLDKGGPQGFMPGYQSVKRAARRLPVEITGKSQTQ